MRRNRRAHRQLNLYNTLYSVSLLLSIMLLLWFAFSVVEVWIHNDTINSLNTYEYSDFNLFELIVKHFDNK